MTYADIDDWINDEFDVEDYEDFEDYRADITDKFNQEGRNPIDKIYSDREWKDLEDKFDGLKDIQEKKEIEELRKEEFAEEEEFVKEEEFAEEEEEKDLIFKEKQKQILKELYDFIDKSFIETDPKNYSVSELQTIEKIIETKPKTPTIKSTVLIPIINIISKVTSFFGKLFK